MAEIRFTGPIAGISGAIGDWVFAHHKKQGITVAYKKKKHRRSKAQKAVTDRLNAGPAFANMALADPIQRQFYETVAEELGMHPYLGWIRWTWS